MTDAELRRALAEALGITIQRDPIPEHHSDEPWYFEFRQADGTWLGGVFGKTEDDAWARAWEPDPECGHTELPDWPADLGAAMALCLEMQRKHGYRLEISPDADGGTLGWSVRFEHLEQRSTRGLTFSASAARALVELALAALTRGG